MKMGKPTVLVLGTCDTKLEELLFLKNQVQQNDSVKALLLDVGRENIQDDGIDISQSQLINDCGEGKTPADLPRGEVVKLMASCASRAVKVMLDQGEIAGIVSAGGSGGTSLAAQVMREVLPIGFPKVLVSTVASGDTGPIVGEVDITMMYSVVDVAGLNEILRDILSNAAAAIASMATSYASRHLSSSSSSSSSSAQKPPSKPTHKRIGITMFGVTTPAVDTIRAHLSKRYPDTLSIFVFHATGTGGRAMERLIREHKLDAVLDLTTTEICDLVTGGVMRADANRLEAAVEAGLPTVVSLGALDMSNFGPRESVPERYRESRRLYEHNPVVTLMRTDEEEARKVGEFIVEKLREVKKEGVVEVWMPLGGVSMIAVPGGPFADEKVDGVLFDTIRQGLKGSKVKLVEDKRAINDEGFAKDIADALVRLMGL